jgi:hypothetical protein
MAQHIGPKIVTDGLVLSLDSGDKNSYPGSGTTWTDLSGNGNDGTLTNCTGESAGSTSGYDTNTGYMMFDRHVGASDGAANNYISVTNSTSLDGCLSQNGMTMEMWLRMDTYTCTAMTKWAGSWEFYYCGDLTHRTTGTGGTDGTSGYSYTNQLNNFHQIIGTHDNTTRTLYVNTVNRLSDSNTVSGQDSASSIGIGAYHGGTYSFQGAMPIYRLYNRALSAKEVSQNFNAHRSRFGL